MSRRDPMAPARPIVEARSGGVCERCGAVRAASIHHRKLRRHGDHAPANLVHLCGSGTTGCHGWVHANPAAALLEGFMCPSWEDPRLQPVKHAWLGRVLLVDDGTVDPVPFCQEHSMAGGRDR